MNERQQRLEQVAHIAVALEAQTGCPAQLLIAQWALESKWGERPVGRFNCFGIKRAARHSLWCTVATREVVSGKSVFEDLEFADYDSLLTYYVGYGGNGNSTTRFRRYDGTAARPLLPEHDLGDKRFLLEANKTYRIKLVARDGVAEFWRDGENIFTYRDPAPLTAGWFAFRTVKSHLEIRHFRVEQPVPAP